MPASSIVDKFYCYLITNQINGKVYVGITNNYEQRKRQHKNVVNSPNDPQYQNRLYRSMRKHSFNSFTFETVKTMSSWKGVCKYEIYLIDRLNAMDDRYGYNMSKGGEGAYGAVRSPETKAKLRAITKKQMTAEVRANLSRLAKEQMSDPKNREISRQGALKQMSDPVMKKKCLSGLKKYYEGHPERYIRKDKCKPCIYNGVEYYSIAEAARQNGMAETTMRRHRGK